jgi:hypothetical protein
MDRNPCDCVDWSTTDHLSTCASNQPFRGSSTVEQAAVNRKVGGSNPPPGAIQTCCGPVDAKTLLAERLKELWERHDKLEREIIALERRFTDEELEALHNDE